MTYESRVRPRMGLTTQKARPKSDQKFFEQKFQNIQILYSSLITWPWQSNKACSEPISRTKRVGTTKQRCFPLDFLRVIQKHHQDSTHDWKMSKLWLTQIFTNFSQGQINMSKTTIAWYLSQSQLNSKQVINAKQVLSLKMLVCWLGVCIMNEGTPP